MGIKASKLRKSDSVRQEGELEEGRAMQRGRHTKSPRGVRELQCLRNASTKMWHVQIVGKEIGVQQRKSSHKEAWKRAGKRLSRQRLLLLPSLITRVRSLGLTWQKEKTDLCKLSSDDMHTMPRMRARVHTDTHT